MVPPDLPPRVARQNGEGAYRPPAYELATIRTFWCEIWLSSCTAPYQWHDTCTGVLLPESMSRRAAQSRYRSPTNERITTTPELRSNFFRYLTSHSILRRSSNESTLVSSFPRLSFFLSLLSTTLFGFSFLSLFVVGQNYQPLGIGIDEQ